MNEWAAKLEDVKIVPVQGRRARRQFLEFPYQLFRNNTYWVPPLRLAQKELLDTRKHPFYKHAEMQCFLALSGGSVMGRIAAILDRTYNEFHNEQTGFFGFLDTTDAEPVAGALVHAAREWLAGHGIRVMRGPVSPSTNYECGVLVEGFDSTPRIMMPYNPPYYAGLLEKAGLRKAKDLYAYHGSPMEVANERAERVAQRALDSRRVRIRPVQMKKFDAEVELVWYIYNSAWSRNWGFVPMSRDEFRRMAREMKPILIPEFMLIGEVDGRAVGFALGLPDINHALWHASGRLFPFGLLKILYHRRRLRNLRVLALGIVEEFRSAGIAAAFYTALIREARKRNYRDCEFSWVLEDNILMNRSMEALSAKRYKTYRIYEWNG